MSDSNPPDSNPPDGNLTDRNPPEPGESLWRKLLWVVPIAAMMSVVQTLLGLMAVVQLIIMATRERQPNAEIAALGRPLGLWLAKAARSQTAASDQRPWPWSPLD